MRYLFLIGFILVSFNVTASNKSYKAHTKGNPLLRFIANHPGLRQFALYTLLAKRCNRYMPDQKSECKKGVKRELEILDYDILFSEVKTATNAPSSFVFIAFKQDLINLLNRKETTEYLNGLSQHLGQFLTGEIHNANIWDFTLNFYKSEDMAAKVIAVLFQDTSEMKLHLAYLEKRQIQGRAHFEKNKETLFRIIDTINMVLSYPEIEFSAFFYPRSVQPLLNKNIYHFYVPYYLALALRREGFGKMAQVAPFMLTLTYEFITHARDFRYLLKDPVQLDPNQDESKIMDIHGGFTGANLGAGLYHRLVPFNILRQNFVRTTEQAIFDLLH